jgi:hypothetical protein
MALWRRTGEPLEYEPRAEGRDIDVGWQWRLDSPEAERYVRVEVASGSLKDTDLPEVARLAITTRGASVVDAVLDDPAPPELLVVSSHGVHPVVEDGPGI